MGTLQEWLDGLGFLDIATLITWVGGAILFIWKVWPILKAVHRVTDRTKDMLDDWFGEDARPGVPARPGVMVRLADQDQRLADNHNQLVEIQRTSMAAAHSSASAAYDSKPNGGGSAYDKMTGKVDSLTAMVTGLADTIGELSVKVHKHDADLSFLSPTEPETPDEI